MRYARLRRGSSVYGVDGAIEVSVLGRAPGDEVLLSLWPTLAEAAADPGSEWYEVHADDPGAEPLGPAETAAVVCFGGPLGAPVRIPHPEGTVRALALWQPDRLNQVVVLLAGAGASLADSRELGADRIEVYQVLSVCAGSPR
jgi:hypothetical protein